ncbi:MAG: hypothetical protein ABEH88_00825 [Halobacteriales archaeon]
MSTHVTLVSLAGNAIGTVGGVLLFVEFFQLPSYISYEKEWDNWNIQVSPNEVQQYTAAGRIGAVMIAIAFALQFVATLL